MIRSWLAEAACRGTDPRLWFPSPRATGDAYALARTICAGCQVRDECLAVALAISPEGDVGIWAGTTPPERTEIRQNEGIIWDDQMPK